jgi:hypothetical protein
MGCLLMHLTTLDTCAEEAHGRAPGGVFSLPSSLILENCVAHYKKKTWVKHDSRQKKVCQT